MGLPMMAVFLRSHRLWALAALALTLFVRAAPAEEAPSPAQAFLKALAAPDSTPERRKAAWADLQKAGKPVPKSVVEAVEKARQRAWRTLAERIGSWEVRKVGMGLHTRIAPHQKAVRDVVAGANFSKAALDKAIEPIQKALDDVLAALKATPKFADTRRFLSETETYAAGTPLRFGWSEELGDTLVSEMVLSCYVAKPGGQRTLESNRHFGAWVDPSEYACIARLNVHRLLLGLEPLDMDLRLVVAARKHSEEMVAKKYFSHTSPTPRFAGFGQRASREHTGASGECIAGGAGDGVGAFRCWFYSQPHHQIMLMGTPAVGVGRCEATWTLMMGGSKMPGPDGGKMGLYVRQRYRAGNDPAAILALGKGCVEARLMPQAEDELERLLVIDPTNEAAKKALTAMRGGGR